MPRPALHRRAGFTLIELVTVTLLLGILAGVAAPRYQEALAATRLDSAARRLAADLRYARTLSLSQAAEHGLVFDVGLGFYQSLDIAGRTVPSADHADEALLRNLTGDLAGVSIASADFGGVAELRFDFRGDPSSSGQVVLTNGASARTVTVNELGEVSISL